MLSPWCPWWLIQSCKVASCLLHTAVRPSTSLSISPRLCSSPLNSNRHLLSKNQRKSSQRKLKGMSNIRLPTLQPVPRILVTNNTKQLGSNTRRPSASTLSNLKLARLARCAPSRTESQNFEMSMILCLKISLDVKMSAPFFRTTRLRSAVTSKRPAFASLPTTAVMRMVTTSWGRLPTLCHPSHPP